LVDDELLGRLRVWSADAAVAEAGDRRRRQRSLVQQAGAEATVAGLARDWAEQRAAVVVRVRSGRSVRGRVAAAGRDFLAVDALDGGVLTIVPLAAVVLVRADGAPVAAAPSPVRAPLTATLAGVLGELATERPVVHVRVDGWEDGARGRLQAAGEDVLTLVVDGEGPGGRSVVYVPLAAVCEVAVVG
jgi:hypothetical protein